MEHGLWRTGEHLLDPPPLRTELQTISLSELLIKKELLFSLLDSTTFTGPQTIVVENFSFN